MLAGGHVAAAVLDDHLHHERHVVGQRGEHVVLVDDLDRFVGLDVGAGDRRRRCSSRRGCTLVESLWFFTTSDLTLSTMSVMSSTTPVIVVNSCWALWTLICVTALPSRLESSMRRRPLPIVAPKPRSNGSAMNLP